MEIGPIGIFKCSKKNPYEAARQASVDLASEIGEIHLQSGLNYEQALEDLQGFSHLWLIYQFHQNQGWNPKVLPPRGSDTKKGVFATRSPYRPNSLGLSCVELVAVEGLVLRIRNFDLLDGTPIFDIKPYLPYSDSFPEAQLGWLENVDQQKFNLTFSDEAQTALEWLESQGIDQFKNFILQQLQYEPLNKHKKRLLDLKTSSATLAYRTWRAHFAVSDLGVHIGAISSGYTPEDLKSPEDKYQDKTIHRDFNEKLQCKFFKGG